MLSQIVHPLHTGVVLPTAATIADDPCLSALCLRALDCISPLRLALVLHADDPVLIGSSDGAVQYALDDMALWPCCRSAVIRTPTIVALLS